MEKNWIRIFTSSDYFQSEMAKQALVGNHIDAVLLNKQSSAHRAFCDIEVYIHKEDSSKAVEVIILNQVTI